MEAIVNPLLRYKVVAKISIKTIKSLTILVKGVAIKGIYESPHASEEEERVMLEKIEKMSRCRALIIGHVNARHNSWDRMANS